jgi:hypothetical protein
VGLFRKAVGTNFLPTLTMLMRFIRSVRGKLPKIDTRGHRAISVCCEVYLQAHLIGREDGFVRLLEWLLAPMAN